MHIDRGVLKLGLRVVQAKLGEAMGDPSFSAFEQPSKAEYSQQELAASPSQISDRSAKIKVPKIITTR